jgi:hypothetical protein
MTWLSSIETAQAGALRQPQNAGVSEQMATYAVWLPRLQDERASARNRLAFSSKESMYADVREAKNNRRNTLRLVVPGLVLVRGRISRALRDEGSNHVH